MKLSIDTIAAIATGTVRVTQEPLGIRFYRFTPEQFDLYEAKDEKFFMKSKTPSGVKLSFCTDSKYMFVKFLVQEHIGASFLSFDIFVDGKLVKSINNFDGVEFPRNYLKSEFPLGEFSAQVDLGEGEKHIVIHLPWNGMAYLQELSLDEGAFVTPVKPEKKLLALGDSITYGNAAMHPSARYVAQLCDALGAEEFNKGIGGEFFCPDLAATRETFTPDYILVAYGTNDWRKHAKQTFLADVSGFFENLNATYPDVKTIIITPTWRSNLHAPTDFASMDEVRKAICEAAAGRKNKRIVDGTTLVPHDVAYFGDYGCHPNDRGFGCYFENLWDKIKDWV